jgi:radical SAM protein with 4Fe4S-binding SPASM domain
MFYYRLPYILYRDDPDFGYLTDNRNFGYDTACKSCVKVGDRVLSKTGSVFYSVLTEVPQSEDAIAEKLACLFVGVATDEIVADVGEFFQELVRDGFVGCGQGEISYPVYFSYADRSPKTLQNEGEERLPGEEDFYEKWGQNYHLSRIHLEVSAPCNERCVHCYFPESYRKGVMPRELFLQILEQCKECNVLSITISGGEPMLNPALLFFIKECRENNFSINLLSNLTLLSDEMLQEFIKTPLLSIQTSLYSMNADVHDSITSVKGSFEKTKRAIETLYKHNVPMQINCPIMKQNKETYQDVLNWAKEMNIEADSDYMLFGCFDESGNNLKCRLELSELEPFVVKELDSGGSKEKGSHDVGRQDYTICPVCISSVCISHAGNVYPCEGWQSYSLGNIKDAPLKQIWEESAGIKELRSLSYDDFPKCRVCKDKAFCSICLIMNANENKSGDFKQVNPYYCKIARMKKVLSSRIK